MAFFRKKSAPTAQAPAPSVPVPHLHDDPQSLAFEAQLAQGRWQEFHEYLEDQADWSMRQYQIFNLAEISGRPEWLDEWAAAKPKSPLPLLFQGAHGVNWAWEARGGGRAHTVEEDAWPLFHERLVQSDRVLAKAAELDDRDPAPHALSVITAKGLSLGQAEVMRRFEQAHARDPLNRQACGATLQAIARKWGGSHESMFAFARWASEQAPDGHSAHKLIALAHIEMWLDAERGEPQQTYFLAEPVKQEVMAAARRSILSPNYQYNGSILSWTERNAFALCFRLMRDYGAQLEQMRLIGPQVTESPWHYQGKPGVIYEKHRRLAFQQLYGVPAPSWDKFLASR